MPVPVLPLALLALAFGLGGSTRKAAPAPTPRKETEAERVARLKKEITAESAEIIHGKREQYSDAEAALLDVVKPLDDVRSSSSPVTSAPVADDSLELAIKEAVEAADRAAQEASDTGVIERPPQPVAPDDDPFVSTKPDEATQVDDPFSAPAPAPAPAPNPFTPSPATEPTPQPAQFPAGYDPAGARRMAPSLARHLKNKGRIGYDRKLLQDFQRKAGIAPDKVYGGQSAGAVLFYGGTEAPAPFFPPLDVIPYTPPA